MYDGFAYVWLVAGIAFAVGANALFWLEMPRVKRPPDDSLRVPRYPYIESVDDDGRAWVRTSGTRWQVMSLAEAERQGIRRKD